jgi:hypothetical protein
MNDTKSTMKMPELLVFAKFVAVGFIGAEIFRCAFYLGTSFANQVSNVVGAVLISLGYLITLIAYAIARGAIPEAKKIWLSKRMDLLGFIFFGALFNKLTVSSFAKDSDLSKFHEALKTADPHWTPVVLGLLYLVLLSPLAAKCWPKIQSCWKKKEKANSQLFFIADDEIKEENDDLLEYGKQAKSFAEAVLQSGAQPGLIFGLDGPWGIGKTGFINLAEKYWNVPANKVIVCRFEPLRYASEADARLNGLFSLKKNPEQNKYENLTAFTEFKISKDTSAKFLLEQLFDAQTLDFGAEESIDESARISRACFNDGNAIHFLDHCLAHLSSTFFSDSGTDKKEYVATPESLSGSLDRIEMANYWRKYRQTILGMNLESKERLVYTSNYRASYKDDLKGVFEALDILVDQAQTLTNESP